MPINALILSHLFWPSLKLTNVSLPHQMQKCVDTYKVEFEAVKQSRILKWRLDVGLVDLDLTLPSGQELSVSVTPLQSAVICLFERQDAWRMSDIVAALDDSKTAADAIQQAVAFWQTRGIITFDEKDEQYLLNEASPTNDMDHDVAVVDEASQTAFTDPRAEQMNVYWSYIQGMLTNLGPLPAARIQMMLSMFVQSPARYDFGQEDLEAFLNAKVREDQLEVEGGVFKMK